MLEELRNACARSAEVDSKRLDQGPLVCHFGYPSPAEPGTVALKLADVVTVIREADVVRVEKHKSLYRVWTRADANVIIRLEKVAKAGGEAVEAGECECDGAPAEGVMARDKGNVTLEIGEIQFLACQTQRICTTVFGRPYCYNVVVCRWQPGGDLGSVTPE